MQDPLSEKPNLEIVASKRPPNTERPSLHLPEERRLEHDREVTRSLLRQNGPRVCRVRVAQIFFQPPDILLRPAPYSRAAPILRPVLHLFPPLFSSNPDESVQWHHRSAFVRVVLRPDRNTHADRPF